MTAFSFILLLSAGSAAAQNVEMGARYAQLDAQAERTITDFGSVRAISIRAPDGSIETTLEAVEGEELSRLSFSQDGGYFVSTNRDGQGPRFSAPPSLTVTSDWANAQAYSLWRDRAMGMALGLLAAPVFDGYLFRHPALTNAGDKVAENHHRSIAAEVKSIRTEFPSVVSETVRNTLQPPAEQRPDEVHASFTTHLFDRTTGERVGVMQWFPKAQTLSWKLAGQATSIIDPKRLAKAHLPAWPFQPNPAWANLQLYGFYEDDDKRVAAASGASSASPTSAQDGMAWLGSTSTSESPLRSRTDVPGIRHDSGQHGGISRIVGNICTNEPDGCTGLHWLDNTIYRQCCDEHDRCYYQDRAECCTWWSWFFPWQQGWSCGECNLNAVWCFLTGGGGGGGGGGGWDGGINEDNECHLDIDQYFCGAQCASCTGGHWP